MDSIYGLLIVVLGIIIVNIPAVKAFLARYYLLIGLIIFPILFYTTVYKNYSHFKLIAFIVLLASFFIKFSKENRQSKIKKESVEP